MDVKTIAVGSLATNCYLLIEGNLCIVVDPGYEGERIARAILCHGDQTSRLTVQAILLTHAHFDHTMAAGYLQKETGAPVFVGAKDIGMIVEPGWMKDFMPSGCGMPSDLRALSEGDRVTLGDVALEVWETPGHSPGSITFVLDAPQPIANATGLSPKMVFCGDLIFRRSVGRTDLPGGDPDQLFNSVDRVLSLPGKTVIYPGHGRSTTVAGEMAANPFV